MSPSHTRHILGLIPHHRRVSSLQPAPARQVPSGWERVHPPLEVVPSIFGVFFLKPTPRVMFREVP